MKYHWSVYWLLFAFGFSMHVLLQAEASRRSKSNGVRSVFSWLAITWPVVLGRFFLCALGMGAWMEMPAVFSKLVGMVSGSAPALPLNGTTVALFGYLSDSFVDKVATIIGIKLEIPQIAPPTE